ncbi:uncharacterized protein NECHADRAFT_58109 [Fusarium vanettenii 77-13-4]|uniref:Ubiquitin conjugating enzyme n=1 Tax=Fusarium vanettenii (strain ATCC MYA-4622 / CBS 123669 / FGSC 9596 / NRRL 45880 / 77-13-4) TaxID=660122 RepID=C7Z799_FUSV7|nr:uncharacterized protein NECHADRAFT_58109 [Fusarium vanettenii 77-13-4]EEU40267.1 hypothetical protein NECHADRAFT_58109 [Fusarium vanettenii 77-13-4]
MIHNVGRVLWERGHVPSDNGPESPQLSWEYIIIILNYIVFIPAILLIDYTFSKVFPLLAMIEDDKPPAYEPLPVEPLANGNGPKIPSTTAPAVNVAGPGTDGRPVTSSFRATFRLVRSHGGFRACFRGLPCLIVQSIFSGLIIGAFSLCLPYGIGVFVGGLVSSIALVQFRAAWIHQVITPQSARSFWSRFPPFKTTLKATWRPTLIFWAAGQAAFALCGLLINTLNIHRVSDPFNLSVRILLASLILILGEVILLIPAWVVLVRIQASLLPADEDTIVPFDRSFNGRVEPAVVGGPGYASVADAWSSFSKAAWRRIILLHVKILGVTIGVGGLLGAFVGLQIFIFGVVAASKSGNSGKTGN